MAGRRVLSPSTDLSIDGGLRRGTEEILLQGKGDGWIQYGSWQRDHPEKAQVSGGKLS